MKSNCKLCNYKETTVSGYDTCYYLRIHGGGYDPLTSQHGNCAYYKSAYDFIFYCVLCVTGGVILSALCYYLC